MGNLMEDMEKNIKAVNDIMKKIKEGKEVTSQDIRSIMSDQDKNNIETAAYCSALYQMLLIKGIFKSEDLEVFDKYKQSYMDKYMESSIQKAVNDIKQMLENNDEIVEMLQMFEEE